MINGIRTKARETIQRAHKKSHERYPQPLAKPVYNNRLVFGVGLLTGLIIGIWIAMFLCMFIPLVFR